MGGATLQGELKSDPWKWGAIAVSVVTLPGVVDDLVSWKEWFEAGWMQHWRFLKSWLLENGFWWAPFHAPRGLVEYLVLGAVVMRSFATANKNVSWRGADNLLAFLAIFLIWPIYVLGLLYGYFAEGDAIRRHAASQRAKWERRSNDQKRAQIGKELTIVLLSLCGGAILVFVASDALNRLGAA